VSTEHKGVCPPCSGDVVINYTKVDLPEEVHKVTDGQGAHLTALVLVVRHTHWRAHVMIGSKRSSRLSQNTAS
jgi:hypothetical protein